MDSPQKAFTIENFLSEKELMHIDIISNKIPKQMNNDEKQTFTSGFNYSLIKKIVDEKLKNIFGEFNVKDCMILEETIPWDIHTDFNKGDTHPYYACLIPLEYDGKDTHTVVFNEEAKNREEIFQLPESENKLDTQTLAILDHCNDKKLQRVSLLSSYKWKRGSLICWHRKLLHASDNFKKNKLDKKKALVMFLNQDKEELNG